MVPFAPRRTLPLVAVTLAALVAAACSSGTARRTAVAPTPWRPAVAAHLAQGDTAAALALLDSVAWRRPRDPSAIHALGMIAWDAVRPVKTTTVGASQADIRLLRTADSSLRWAARSAPDSARFALDLGRWMLYGNMVQLRVQAGGWIDKAAEAARRMGDSLALADALDEQGMLIWRSHENVARRRLVQSGRPMALGDPRRMGEFIENGTVEVTPIPGLDEAGEAIRHFREALAAAPWRRGPARHLAMALAEWERWEELARFAGEWTRARPDEPLAWASAGLAAQRTGRTRDAERAFDSTLARLSPAERARWTRLSRLTTAPDSVKHAGLAPEARQALEQGFWGLADPVTLTPEHEIRTEFLARVAFAELRWTSEDFDRPGADTDRGDILVRYGPPPVRFTLNQGGVVSQHVWWYPATRIGFVFDATVGYGTAAIAFDQRNFAEQARHLAPSRWDNVPVIATLDSVQVQTARFRAGGAALDDSTDLVVFAELPIERMAKGIDVATGTVETRFVATDARGRTVADERSSEVVRFARPDAASKRAFRTRLAPGEHAVRVEAWQETAGKAARAIAALRAEPARGAGTRALATSDLLVADRVVPRDSASATRWTDLRLVPNVGTLRLGQPFGIAWETYDLAARDGQARYEVTLELVLVEIDRSFLPRADMTQAELASARVKHLAARVLGGIGDVVGTTAEGDARIALRYTRARGGAGAGGATLPVALDWLSLELGDAPRGRYELTVTVRDLATGERRTTSLAVRVVP